MYYWVCQKCDLKVWGAENCWCGINREQNSALAEKRYNEKKGTQKMDKHYVVIMEWSHSGNEEGTDIISVTHNKSTAVEIIKSCANYERKCAIERGWHIITDIPGQFYAVSGGYNENFTRLYIVEK